MYCALREVERHRWFAGIFGAKGMRTRVLWVTDSKMQKVMTEFYAQLWKMTLIRNFHVDVDIVPTTNMPKDELHSVLVQQPKKIPHPKGGVHMFIDWKGSGR